MSDEEERRRLYRDAYREHYETPSAAWGPAGRLTSTYEQRQQAYRRQALRDATAPLP